MIEGQASNPLQQLAELLKKLGPLAQGGRPGAPAGPGGGGTPASIGHVFDPNNPAPTPVFSTPPPAAVAPTPGTPSPLLGSLGTQFANTRAKSGATALSAVDSVAQAITSFKQKSDADNITKAQNSLNMFTNALQKGDMQVANLLASDKKIVKSWEKYLKMEFPRVPGGQQGPDGKPQLGQLNQPGGIAATRDTTAELMQALALQKQQADVASQQATTEEHKALAGEATARSGLATAQAAAVPLTTQADVDRAKAQTIQANAEADLAKARAATEAIVTSDTHGLNEAQKNMMNAQAQHFLAQRKLLEFEIGAGGTPAELNQLFSKDYSDLTNLRNQAFTDEQKLEASYRQEARSITGRVLGSTSQDEIKDALNRYNRLNKAVAYYNSEHDNIIKGKTSSSDAYQKALGMAGFDTNLAWRVPDGAPEAPKKDGQYLMMGGKITAVSSGGKWVEPTVQTPQQ